MEPWPVYFLMHVSLRTFSLIITVRLKFWHRDSVLVVPVVQVLELAVETFRCLIINASEIRVATVS
jgi:hypothetical protein